MYGAQQHHCGKLRNLTPLETRQHAIRENEFVDEAAGGATGDDAR
jgi:hypothetical protein